MSSRCGGNSGDENRMEEPRKERGIIIAAIFFLSFSPTPGMVQNWVFRGIFFKVVSVQYLKTQTINRLIAMILQGVKTVRAAKGCRG